MKRIISIFFFLLLLSGLLYFINGHDNTLKSSIYTWYEDTAQHVFQQDRQTQPFGHYKNGLSFNGNNRHYGVDYHLPEGTPILAASDGTITRTINDPYGGKIIELYESNNQYYQWYGHLSTFDVKPGQTVEQGAIIGKSGNTGKYSTGPHLHFQRMKGQVGNDYAIDPEPFIETLPNQQYSLFQI
ncbi:M23 family metallopeptidase [Staphylococcus sp. 17KM0847]|uniref:M23 family metallopeptidase n=1 Tax=Staphylococcus sp. 17KM0847 TaxID=2583989 RepID=UPI0015DBDD6A|nr:M23 family metallopeptidase [Staphylococcus sp. 17KM0847]QLK86805.1 M23 family metallopeptidase [Staphylococcus sp. 17KM0847]